MKPRGFTLVELIVTVAIVAILLTIGIPSFNDMIVRRRVIGAAEEVFSQLAFARMEAVKRSRPIRVDFSAANSTTWRFGITDDLGADWVTAGCEPTIRVAGTGAKTDAEVAANTAATVESCSIDQDGSATTTGDRVLYQFTNAEYPSVTMRGWSLGSLYRNDPAFGSASYVTFDSTRGTVSASGRVVVCSGKKELHVIVGLLGRPRFCTPDRNQMPAYPACVSGDGPTTPGGC